jgi:superoxide dismutase, Cu-Zn family
MRKIGLLLVCVMIAGCDDDDFDDDDFDDDVDEGVDDGGDTTPPPQAINEWRAELSNIEPSWVVGSAVVQQTVGEQAFTAAVMIREDIAGAARPWHVHFGTCATGGGIVGDPAAYPPLVTDTAGAATSNVLVRVGLDVNAPYHVNVHESEADLNTLIACGDLVLQ